MDNRSKHPWQSTPFSRPKRQKQEKYARRYHLPTRSLNDWQKQYRQRRVVIALYGCRHRLNTVMVNVLWSIIARQGRLVLTRDFLTNREYPLVPNRLPREAITALIKARILINLKTIDGRTNLAIEPEPGYWDIEAL